MSDGGASTVGVVGDASDAFADAVADAGGDLVADAGGDPVASPADDVLAAEPTVVVAVGESAFVEVASRAPDAPLLAVDAGRGVRSVQRGDLPACAEAVVAGEWTTESHPLLTVAVDGAQRGTAVLDVALVTSEAAHISEYDLAAGDERLDSVRADGVVVATPAGSTGYARRVGAPVLAPGTGVVVAPVAPFATDPDHWVVDPDGLTLDLVREEAPVDLVVDDAVVGAVDPSETVTVSVDDRIATAIVPASRSRYGRN